jgi:hypothetical protein
MEPVYYRPYLVYHKDHDENNLVMVPYETGICHTKDRARNELITFANKFFHMCANPKYKIRVRMVDGFPYIMKRVGAIREVVIGYTNIGYVYPIGNYEYSYLGFVIKRVGNTFRVYDSRCEKFIGMSTIDIDEMRALNEALNVVDNIFHSPDQFKSILGIETERKIEDVFE